jgi:hypothetical protein
MKHPMPQRPLRFATAQAYDLPPRGPGGFWVARSAEQFALDEPFRASRGFDSTAHAVTETAEKTERRFIDQETGAVGTNPLRDEPSPLAVGAVKRFGLVGLVSVAVGTGIARWWNSFGSRDH